MRLIKNNKSITQKVFNNLNDDFKLYCKKLGGFVNVIYEDDKPLLYDLNLTNNDKFRLLYLASYIDYCENNKNVLIRHGKNNKVEYIDKKYLKQILNLPKSTFNDFIRNLKDNDILYEDADMFRLSTKYFSKGRTKNRNTVKIFIYSIRELYNNCSSRGHSKAFLVYKLSPYSDVNNIVNNKYYITEICKHIDIETKTFYQSIRVMPGYILKNGDKYILNPEYVIKYNEIPSKDIRLSKSFISKGESIIKDVLIKNNIRFEEEYSFDNLIGDYGGKLRYDFYLPEHDILIEFQGKQHNDFIPYIHETYDNFILLKKYDKLKKEYALKNDLYLLEIWYYSQDMIEHIILNHLNIK